MKKPSFLASFALTAVLVLSTALSSAQDSIQYQLVIRDAAGQLITSKQVNMKFSLISGGQSFYEETQKTTTDKYGNISVFVGTGTAVSGSMKNVPWSTMDISMKVEADTDGGNSFKELGTVPMPTAPYAMYAAMVGGNGNNGSSKDDEALFEVCDRDGQPVFAVYSDGIVVYVDETAKAKRSGFVVTGRSTKDGESADYFSVDAEGTHVYVDDDTDNAKVKRSGFVVTGRATKGASGSYAAERTADKGTGTNIFAVSGGLTTVYVDTDDSKAKRSGFVVTGRSSKGGNFVDIDAKHANLLTKLLNIVGKTDENEEPQPGEEPAQPQSLFTISGGQVGVNTGITMIGDVEKKVEADIIEEYDIMVDDAEIFTEVPCGDYLPDVSQYALMAIYSEDSYVAVSKNDGEYIILFDEFGNITKQHSRAAALLVLNGKTSSMYIRPLRPMNHTIEFGLMDAESATSVPYEFVKVTAKIEAETGHPFCLAEMENGTVSVKGNLFYGENVTLTAMATDGYYFAGWNDEYSDGNVRTIDVAIGYEPVGAIFGEAVVYVGEDGESTTDDAVEFIYLCGDRNANWTIKVNGVVTGPQNISDHEQYNDAIPANRIVVTGNGSNAALEGEWDENHTPETKYSVLTIGTSVPVTIENLKISKGYAEYGGGVNITRGSNVTLGNGALITGNRATYGGGVFADECILTIEGTAAIDNNSAYSDDESGKGGGIYLKCDDTIKKCILAMGGGVIKNNKAITKVDATTGEVGSYGGGVYVGTRAVMYMYGKAVVGDESAEGAARIESCSNYANCGGGVYLASGNQYYKEGGILYMGYKPIYDEEGFAEPELEELEYGIYYNHASYYREEEMHGTGKGGGVSVQYAINSGSAAKLIMASGNIKFNDGQYGGGGVMLQTHTRTNAQNVVNPEMTITGGTIQGNTCTSQVVGRGVQVGSVGSYNAIFNISGSATVDVDNDVYLEGRTQVNIVGEGLSGDGTVAAIGVPDGRIGTRVLSANENLTLANFTNRFTVNDNSERLYINDKGYIVANTINVGTGGDFETIEAAIEAINMIDNSDEEYTIKVVSNLNGPQNISGEISAAGINIEGIVTINDDIKTLYKIDAGWRLGSNNRWSNEYLGSDANISSALTINTTTPVTVKNLRITGGYLPVEIPGGGGISIGSGADVTLADSLLVTGNTADYGGGVSVYYSDEQNTKLTIGKNVEISGNTALKAGGGVLVYSDNAQGTGTVTMTGGTIKTNSMTNSSANTIPYGGGGVSLYGSGSSMTMGGTDNPCIIGNDGYNGAGVCVLNGARFTMNGGSIEGNNGEGGVYISGTEAANGEFVMTDGEILGNTSRYSYGKGVYVGMHGKLIMSGKARINANNDVSLYTSSTSFKSKITIGGAFSGTGYVATIYPTYSDHPVLDGEQELMESEYGRFAVVPETLDNEQIKYRRVSADGRMYEMIGSKPVPDALGDIVFVDGSAMPFSEDLTENQISAAYAVVFDAVNKKVVAIDQRRDGSNVEIEHWCESGALGCQMVSGANSETDGKANTKAVYALDGFGDGTQYPPFKYAKNYSAGGYNDWYVPAIGELETINDNIEIINASLEKASGVLISSDNYSGGSPYWSSTQHSEEGKAYAFSFNGNGSQNGYIKQSENCQVRCVRQIENVDVNIHTYYIKQGGNNYNDGLTPGTACATINGAWGRIHNNTTEDCTIKVMGQITNYNYLADNANATDGQRITITGASTELDSNGEPQDALIGDPSSSLSYVLGIAPASPVTITNLKITGGNNNGIELTTVNADVTIGENVLVTGNTGYGVRASGLQFTMLPGSKVIGNAGGGVMLDYGGVFDMRGGEIKDNTGHGVYLKDEQLNRVCSFKMSGSAKVDASNDVYLSRYYSINKTIIVGDLDAGNNIVATITPQSYTVDGGDAVTVLEKAENGTLSADDIARFAVTPQADNSGSGATTYWKIVVSDNKGVLEKIPTVTVSFDDVTSAIQNLTENSVIKVTGTMPSDDNDLSGINSALKDLASHSNIWVSLDLSGLGGLTKLVYQKSFEYCKNLLSITLPSTITSVSNNAFFECPALKEILVAEGGDNFYSTNGILYQSTGTESSTLVRYPNAKSDIEVFEVPQGVTVVADNAFTQCTGLKEVVFPNDVSSIGLGAFSFNTVIERVTLPNGLKEISNMAFDGCKALEEIVIPDNVESIGVSTFMYCERLTLVVIPSKVTTLCSQSFAYCKNLETISLPKSLTTIKGSSFSNCNKLSNVKYEGTEADKGEMTISDETITLIDWTYETYP